MRELDLLKHVYAANKRLPRQVVIPPGDDMGAIRLGGETVLVTVDQVIDGVHVKLADTPLELVGRKAVTRNLSDVAAMAAKPLGAVVAAALPRGFGEANATKLFDAMRQTAEGYDCPLVGGDIAMHDGALTLSVTIFAEPAGIDPILRSGANVGDAVCVSGKLGGSWRDGARAHLEFEPRIELARRLAGDAATRPSSMIDLSDGLASDLARICEQSNVAAVIDAAKIPTRKQGGDALAAALFDGEDYELCFTLSEQAARALPHEIAGVPLSIVGHIISAADAPHEGRIWLTEINGERRPLTQAGWEHHT